MQHITKEHRSKLAVTFYLLSLACLIGLIAIFISFSLLFYRKWPFDTNKPCPESQTFKFVNKISILQIIYTVMLGLFTLCLLVLVIVLLKHKYNIQKYWHVSNKFRILYPLFIAIGLVAGIVALLLVIKFYARIQQVIYYYYDGALPVTCLTSSELNDINNKLTPLIILIVLISLMIFFTIWAFCLLPYRYFRQGQIQNYQEIVPLQNKVQDKLEVLHVPKLEISHQELLAAPVVSARNYVTTGIGDENVNVSENILPQVGQQLAKPELKNAGVGNHFEYKNQVTDCQGLIKQIQYKTQSVNTYQQIEKVANKKNVEQNGMFILKEPAKKADQTVDKFLEVPVEKNLKLAAYRPSEITLKREIQMPAQKSILKPIQIPIKKQVQVLVQERHAELVLPKRIQSSSMQLLQKKPIQKQTKNSDAIQINKISLPESQIASSKLSIKNIYEIKIDKQGQPSKDKFQLNVTPSRLRNLQRTETRQVDPELLTPRNKGLQTKFMQVQVPEKVEGIEKPDTQNEVYYYNKSNSGSQVSIRSKGMRKVQKSHINSPSNHLQTEFSSRKLIQDDKPILRATKGLLGQNGIDWSHYNILWAGERINKIYTPPKTPKSQLRSSNKSSFQKWQQQSSKKQKI